jgi:probable HAF family extracellular repeat protein
MPVYSFTTFDDPLAFTGKTDALGINDTDQIVGNYRDASGGRHGFLLSGGTYTTLDDPLATNTFASGINASGQIVGYYRDASGGFHGFLLSGGTYTTLDDPLAFAGTTRAFGINDMGQIVGSYDNASGGHGFLLSGGMYTTIDDPLGTDTFASGINAAGQIVGTYETTTPGTHSFLYSGGLFTTMDDPVVNTQTIAHGINDNSQIVGTLIDGTGNHGFLETSLPNPPPLAGTTADMVLRGANTSPAVMGQYEIYDIGNNAILAGYSLGQVGPSWAFVTLGGFFGSDTTDLVLRNVNTGAFEVYDIANNMITSAASLGQVGLDWQLGGFAVDPPTGSMGSSGSTSQLVQAMAGFGGGSGTAESLNTAAVGADTSQQPSLTTPQHA